MNTPRDVDLFLAMWNASINSEDSYTPGTQEWREGKKRMQAHWLKIWIDCKDLCDHILKYENLISGMRVDQPGEETQDQLEMETADDEPVV